MNCYLCKDKGIVRWMEKSKYGMDVEYMGRCDCHAGDKWHIQSAAPILSPWEIENITAQHRKEEENGTKRRKDAQQLSL